MEEDKARSLPELLASIIQRQVKPDVFEWLALKGKSIHENVQGALPVAFAAVPRKTGRTGNCLSEEESRQVALRYPELNINNWSIDKLCRLWLLMQVNDTDHTLYHETIESLFRNAEMHELAALYACLPVFSYPGSWQFRCTEGVRSNIGLVLEAIMYDNPYPYQYLPDSSWNQLVLKAFFTEKDVNRIIGLDQRSNKALASILLDYAHERMAAHRDVNPILWRLVSKFIDEVSFIDIEKLFDDTSIRVRRAAVLACFNSSYEPALRLMEKEPAMLEAVKRNELNWESV